MNPWMNEDIFKSWTEAQKRLWESLCSAVPFQPPAGVEAWRETYLKNLVTWESAVKQTLAQEVAWVEQWVHQVAQERGTPEVMVSWVRQMEEVLQRWVETQNQWWDDYFTVLRQGGFGTPDRAHPSASPTTDQIVPVAEPASAPEPQFPAVPVVVTASQSVASAESVPVTADAASPPKSAAPAAPVAEAFDDLRRIHGIGAALEKKLHGLGITHYLQLATLSDADIERIERSIKMAGRIHRDDWIGQAKVHHFKKYQEAL